MTPERARWLLDNPFPNPYVTDTAAQFLRLTAPYVSAEDDWRALTCVDL